MARPPIDPGRLRTRVEFLARQATQDGAGQPVDEWVSVAAVLGDVRSASGLATAERIAAGADVSLTAYSVRIRYRPSITSGLRARFGGVVADVAQVAHDMASRRYTDVVCVVGGVAA